jgi:TatD DNase family protein
MTTALQYIDSHCHFDFPVFDGDRQWQWEKCQALGVNQLVIPGVSPDQWQGVIALSESLKQAYFGVGVHPWWLADLSAGANLRDLLESGAQHSRCVAIGETGLDACIATPLAAQQASLAIHLQVAKELALPLILHCRKAHNELILLLKHYAPSNGGVIHGFSGSLELAQQYWALGFYLGVGGTITYDRAQKTRQTFRQMPLASLLLETDAPDMPLQGKQGQRNSPEYLPEIAQALANLRGEPLAQIAQVTTANAKILFGI